METTSRSMRSRLLIAALVGFGCALAVLVAVPGAAVAGDGTTLLEFEDGEHEVQSGETVSLDLVAYDHGDSSGDGLASFSFALEYDADVLTATDVEHGSMLVAGDDVDLVTESEREDGRVTVEQERDPVGDGATGNEVVATVTFEVHDDAGATSTTVEPTDAQAYRPPPSDWPVYPVTRDATIHVDGGAEPDEADESDDGDGSPPGVTFADDLEDDESESEPESEQPAEGDDGAGDVPTDDESADEPPSGDDGELGEDGSDETAAGDDADSDAVSGFAVVPAIAGLVGALAVWLRGRRR